MDNLHADIILKITEPPQNVGTAKVEFLLQKNETLLCLYIDANVTFTLSPRSFEALVNFIVLHVAQRSGIDIKKLEEAESAIGIILKAESEVELFKHLEDVQVSMMALTLKVSMNPSIQILNPNLVIPSQKAGSTD